MSSIKRSFQILFWKRENTFQITVIKSNTECLHLIKIAFHYQRLIIKSTALKFVEENVQDTCFVFNKIRANTDGTLKEYISKWRKEKALGSTLEIQWFQSGQSIIPLSNFSLIASY